MARPLRVRLLRLRVTLAGALPVNDLHVTLFWAGVVGFLGGVSSLGFRACIRGFQWLLTQRTGSLVGIAASLPAWERAVIPAAGGFLAGAVLYFGMRLTRGERSTDYMEAIALGDGVIRTRPSLVKTLSSLLTISSGGSIGREGSMVQVGAWLASFVGRHTGFAAPRLRLLVACGAAAGIAAAYNAPIAGALFVAEIILGSIAMESFGPLVLASVISTLTVRGLGNGAPVFVISPFHLVSAWELILCFALGLAAGVAAPAFLWLLRASEELFTRARLPVYWRLALGGLIVGLLSIQVPQVWGNGNSVISSILHAPWPWALLLGVLACKVLGTAATFGSGAAGGVFTPTLFVGAAIGCLFGQGVQALAPGTTAPPSAYALVGMGALLAGTTHAPLMAMLMLFEMTLNYELILPLMLGCVTAYYVAQTFGLKPVYAESLRSKERQTPEVPLTALRVRDLMRTNAPRVPEAADFAEVARQLTVNRRNHLYVVDSTGRFLGAVALHDVKGHLQSAELARVVTAFDLMHPEFPCVAADAPLKDTLEKFSTLAGERLPVIDDPIHRRLLGSLAKTDVLLAIAHGGVPPAAETGRRTDAA